MDEKIHIVRAEKAFEFKHTVSDIWNPGSIVPGTQLGRMVGLERTRVTLLRIAPAGAASLYHANQCEEEWIYVLQGQGVIEVDETEHLLGPGDFAGFPAGSAPHQLRNPFGKSLICLSGGERLAVNIADFPRLGRRMFRHGDSMEVYDTSDAEEVAPANLDEILTNRYRRTLRKD